MKIIVTIIELLEFLETPRTEEEITYSSYISPSDTPKVIKFLSKWGQILPATGGKFVVNERKPKPWIPTRILDYCGLK